MIKMKTWGQMVSLVLAVSVVLSACGTGGSGNPSGGGGSQGGTPSTNGDGQAGSQQEPAEPTRISMLNVYMSNTAPKDDSPIVTETERIGGAELDITYVPSNVYSEKLNVTMTSGEMPQVIMTDNPFTTSILNGIRSGMFWDLTPFLDEFPNLKNYDERVLNNLAVDGKYYVIPRPRPLVRLAVIIRQDWLENVGLEEPTTVDELYTMLKAFKEQDPDQNGVDDTYGMMFFENNVPSGMFAWFGAPNQWKVDENGNFIKDAETPEYREGLKFVRQLFEEGLMNQDFAIAVRNEARKALYNNKVGSSMESIDAVVPFYYLQMRDTQNYYDMTVSPPINGTAFAASGHYGGGLISKTSVKTEDELRAILRFFDNINSEEGKAEFVKLVQENEAKPAEEQFNTDDLKNLITTDAIIYPVGETETDILLRNRMAEHAEVSIINPAEGLISPTQTEKNEQLNTILTDARTQYIMGVIDDAGYDAAVMQWKKNGGDQVAQELAELYKQK